MLNEKYFKHITTVYDEKTNMEYLTFSTVHGPVLVHRSKIDGSYLAAFGGLSNGKGVAFALRKNVSKERKLKYAMLIPENKQLFNPFITNLNTLGYIDYNLMREDEHAEETDPGPTKGYNQVNELKPLDSYLIPADQANNRQMIIQEVKKDEKSISMKKAEEIELKKEKQSGLEIFLTIVPQKNISRLVELFTSTMCEVTNMVVIKRQRNNPRMQMRGVSDDYLDAAAGAYCISEMSDSNDDSRIHEQKAPIYRAKGCMRSASKRQCAAISRGVMAPINIDHDDMMLNAHVAEMSYGESVDVNSGVTGITYDFSKSTIDCSVLCTVYPKLKYNFVDINDKLLKTHAQDVAKQLMNDDWKLIVEKVEKFSGEECCVCLENKPDTILYPCSHTIDMECAKKLNPSKCPICRQLSTAMIKI